MQPLYPRCSRTAHNFAEIIERRLDKALRDGQNPYHSLSPFMTSKCKHPIVKVVAREDDAEFVECQSCGEVFDSAEYSDIAIEEADGAEENSVED